MNVLVNISVAPEHRAQLIAVSDRVQVQFIENREALLGAAPEAEVLFGRMDDAVLSAARRLRWVQVPAAGVYGILTPAFVASPVTLVSAKGTVGAHLADHAMALLLALIRGIHTALREKNGRAQP